MAPRARTLIAAALCVSTFAIAGYAFVGTGRSGESDGELKAVRAARPFAPDEAGDLFTRRSVPPVTELAGVSQRPLFSPTRRPAEPAPPPPAPVAVTVPPPKIDTGQYRLMGVVIEGETRIAVLRAVKGNGVYRAGEGERIEEWTVVTIEPSAVTLRQGDVDDIIRLQDNDVPAVRRAAGRPPEAGRNPAVAGQPGQVVPGAGVPRAAPPPARRVGGPAARGQNVPNRRGVPPPRPGG
jgi:hypothetical protein